MRISVQKMTILTFIVAGIMALALPDAKANTGECEGLKTTPKILECLNKYGRKVMGPDSEAQALFHTIMSEDILPNYPNIILDRLGVKPLLEAYTNKHSRYPIHFIDKEREFKRKDTASGTCFNFEKHKPTHKVQAIKALKRQADEVAIFLANFHAKSLGGNSSFVFPLRKVRICDTMVYGGKDRHLMFSQNNLLVGFHFSAVRSYGRSARGFANAKVVKAEEIQEQWTNGDMWRRVLLQHFVWQKTVDVSSKLTFGLLWDYREWRDRLFIGLDKDAVAPVLDRIADYWSILDPISEGRVLLLRRIANRMGSVENLSDDKFGAMGSVAVVDGFPVRERDYLLSLNSAPEKIEAIYRDWKKKMFSPLTIVHAIESSMGSASNTAQLELIARDVHDVGVNVRNAKSFDISAFLDLGGVDIENFQHGKANPDAQITSEYVYETFDEEGRVTSRKTVNTDQQGQSDVYVNLDNSTDVGVNVDLIDKFDIESGLIPKFSAEQLSAYALYKAINEYMKGR